MNNAKDTKSCPRRNWLRAQALSSHWKNALLRLTATAIFWGLVAFSQSRYAATAVTKLVTTLGIPLKEPFYVSQPLPPILFIVVWSTIFTLLANVFVDLFLSRQLTRSRLLLLSSIVTVSLLYAPLYRVCSSLVSMALFLLEALLLALGYNYLSINRRIEGSFLFALAWLAFAFPLSLRAVVICNPGILPEIFNKLI